tara:strand:+ start:444 stop:830 length:387 start_codon:yes stop_codon:yes gene_type:complete
MASNTITFDPDSGVPYGANLTIYGGTDFTQTFNVKDTSNTVFNFTSYSAAGKITKSLGVGATTGGYTTFSVGITSAVGGVLTVSLTDTQTKTLDQGRYMYDVLVTVGSTTYPLVNGNVYVYNTVTQQT